jgi:hypothetical protein
MVNMSECWQYEASVGSPLPRRRVSSKKDGNIAKIPIIISQANDVGKRISDMAARIAVVRVEL